MELKISAFVCAIFGLFVVSSHSASITNGKLLKFYPITRQHYRDIIALTKKQPVVSEADVYESHRSLADWSNKLQENWNTLLNSYGVLSKNITLTQNAEKSYPICVIKTRNPLRRKRSGRQYVSSNEYAGLAPNVLFSNSYYGTPQHVARQFSPYVDENVADDFVVGNIAENEGDDDENFANEYEGNHDTGGFPYIDESHNIYDPENNTPIINCVVVIRRKNKRKGSGAHFTNDQHNYYSPYPQYPHYPYPYPPPIPPHNQYVHPYPPYHPYPHKYYPSNDDTSSRSNTIDPAAVAHYQRMMANYYRQLHALYNADAGIDSTRSEDNPEDNNNKEEVPTKSESS